MDLNIQIPDNTASIFEYLQKGLFISSNSTSEEVRDMYNEIDMVIDNSRKQLLDHILFTQAFVNNSGKPKIDSHAGLVEHTIHEKINASLSQANETSDHRPVSVKIDV